MDVAASVIAIVEISANITVWCVQYVRDVAHEAEQATTLCQEVGALQTVLARLQSPAVSGETVRQLEPVLKLCLSDVTALQKRLEPAQGWRRTQQKLVWPFKKRAEFKVAVEKLQRHVSLFTAALSVDLSTLPAQISEHINTLSQLQISHHAEVLTEFDNLRRTLDDTHLHELRKEKESSSADQREETLKWLKVVDYDSNFIQNLELLHPQTGRWFTQSQYYRNWLDAGSVTRKNVWLCGQAGSGKTVLMSAIVGEAKRSVQALQDMVSPGLKVCIAYFYFDFRDHLKRTSQSLLYSILHQLAVQSSILPPSLIDKKKRSVSHDSLSLSELTTELIQIGAGFDHFMLFLDALDECQDFPELLKVLRELTRMLPRINLIVSSRDELEIKRGIDSLGFDRYPISANSVDSDIATYVKEVVQKDEKNRFTKFPETLKQLVVNNLTASSQGMFRWAQCQVDEVSRCRSVKEVLETLVTLPKTLNETYQRMLENMNESEKKWAKRALVWLVGARYPMTLGMLAEAVAIDLQRFDIDDDDRLFDPEQLLDICRSLVTTVEDQDEPKSRFISLAHFSVEQYLRSQEAALWFLPITYVDLCLAKACLVYSVSPVWEPVYERWKKEEDAKAVAPTDTFRFAEYCCVYLFEHLQSPGVEIAALPFLLNIVASERFKNFERNCVVFQFLTGRQCFLVGHQDRTIALQRDTLGLCYTSSFVAKAIMYDLNATALSLIDLDIDTAAVDASSSSAISFLTAKRAVVHVRRLLSVTRRRFEAAASLDSAEAAPALAPSAVKILGMGLLVAIAANEDGIVDILLDEMLHYISLFGAHRQLATKIGKLAAIGATLSSAEGNLDALVRLLHIVSSSSSLTQSEEELVQEALYCACKHGRQDCVSYLLRQGYQPKTRVLSPKSEDLLYAAHDELLSVATRNWLSYCDSLYFLELLPGYHDKFNKTYPRAAESNALDAALAANHTSIAQMLMDVGMSVPSGHSAEKCVDLIDASEKKDLNTMKALLASGADPNMEMEMSRLRTPLIAALSAGWTNPKESFNAVVELLQHGADITKHVRGAIHTSKFPTRTWDMRPGSPFMSAVEACVESFGRRLSEAEEIFRLLEDFSALQEINQYVSSDDFGTPLIAAAALGQTWLVDYLLNHVAQADLQGQPTSDWCFPALAAIYGRHPQLGLRLLEHEGYETLKRAPEKWAKCFIFVCAQVEHTSTSSWNELFTALLDRGIDPNYIADIDDDWCGGYDDDDDDWDRYEAPALFGNAIIAACTSGALPIVKALLEKGVDEKAPSARPYGTCLAAACGSGNVELVQFFIDKGYDVNEVTARCSNWCPLVAAVCSESYEAKEVVELLLERGAMADIQYQSSNGVVSDEDLEIMVCTMHKSWHHTLILCRMWQDCRITGASPIRRHPLFQGSPFIAAVADRKVDAMKSLAARGADVNLEVRAGFYPTGMLATLDMKKAYRVQYTLSELGGTPISPSQMLDYPSPFSALLNDTDHFIGSALLTRPGSFWGSMLTLAVNVKVAIPYLLEQNADPDEVVPGSFYGSAMVAAAALLQAHAVLAFMERGGGVNKVASEGAFGTPLIAVCAGPPEYPFKYSFDEEYNLNDPEEWEQVQLDLIEILLDAGADPNLTYGSFSPLIALVCSTSTKKIHGLKMLLEHGADPSIALPRYSFEATSTAENSNIITPTWTAGYLAITRGEDDIAALLEQYANRAT